MGYNQRFAGDREEDSPSAAKLDGPAGRTITL
jgi:hypothetical protein